MNKLCVRKTKNYRERLQSAHFSIYNIYINNIIHFLSNLYNVNVKNFAYVHTYTNIFQLLLF